MNNVVALEVAANDTTEEGSDKATADLLRQRIGELADLMNVAAKRGIDTNFRMGKDEIGAIKAEIVIQRVTVETL